MYLDEFAAMEGRGALAKIQRRTGLAYTTIHRAKRHTVSYESARKISDATDGRVSIEELCEPRAWPASERP